MPHSGKTMTFATDLVPQEDNIYSLGYNNQRWKIYGDLQPLSTKIYNAPLYNSSSGANYYQTFATVTPVDYNALWIAHYRIIITANGHSDYTEICDVSISGRANTYYSYKIYNSIVTYSIYLHMLLNSNSATVPHELGYRIQGSYGADSVAKVVKVELLEQINCTITLLDNLKLYTSATPSGYTWRGFNATSNGLQETSDSDAYGYYVLSNGFKGKAGSNKVYKQCLFARTGDGTYESFVMQNDTIAATKTVNPHGFMPDGKIYWNSSNTVFSEGTLNLSPYQQYHTIDYRYSFNFNNTFLPDYCETYVVYTYNENDGLLYLDATQWLAAALPTTADSKIYQRIGSKYYTGTSNYYQCSLLLDNPYYEFKNGKIRVWTPSTRSIKSITRSGTTFTATRDDGSTFTFTQQDTAGITSVTIGATSPVQSSTSTAQSGSSASTTISLKDAYGDTKNPYGTKAKNLVLAGPSSGSNAAPTFRALVAADIPSLAYVPATGGVNDVNTLVNTGIYNITSGSATNTPKGYGYGQLLVMSYRKHKDNTTTDWASQLYLHNGGGTASGSASAPGNVLYYRTGNSASSNTWFDWQKVVHVDDAYTKVGDTNKPVYIAADGTATAISYTIAKSVPADAVFTDTNKYHKTGSWNGLTYTATAVNSADELKFTVPNKIQTNWELNAASGNSPALLFTRDGSLTDWKILVTSGKLSFQSATDGTTWTERAYFKDNSGDFVATSFTGNGSDLTDLNASNISSGTLNLARLGNQNANYVLAGPTSGNAATPTWRTIVAADLPTATTDALGIMKVGTGLSVSSGTVSVIYGNVANKAVQGNQTIFKLNGGNINSGSNASFYAPITYGTAGYILKANGESEAPFWVEKISYNNLPTNDSFILTEGDNSANPPTTAQATIPSNYALNKKIYYSSNQPTGTNAIQGMFWFKPADVTIEDLKCLPLHILAAQGSSAQTFDNPNITEDMVVIKCDVLTPSAQSGDVTWTTSNGHISLAGTFSTSTYIDLYLMRANQEDQ